MNRYCVLLKFSDGSREKTLLGLILSEDPTFIEFKTRTKTARINKNAITSIEGTDIPFVPGDDTD